MCSRMALYIKFLFYKSPYRDLFGEIILSVDPLDFVNVFDFARNSLKFTFICSMPYSCNCIV